MKSNTIYPPMSEREISGAAISREAATQGMVLLKNINGVLPLKGRGKIALFGNGAARTDDDRFPGRKNFINKNMETDKGT